MSTESQENALNSILKCITCVIHRNKSNVCNNLSPTCPQVNITFNETSKSKSKSKTKTKTKKSKTVLKSNQSNVRKWREFHNSDDGEDDESDDESDAGGGEGGGDEAGTGAVKGGDGGEGGGGDGGEGGTTDAVTKMMGNTDGDFNTGSIHYVDACTLWKFPNWLVDRLDCSKEIEQHETLHTQQMRRTLLKQLKATSIDLLMYATVRREFLRTILVIELNNVARLLEIAKNLEVNETLRTNFFNSLQPCVKVLEDQRKIYSQDMVTLANIMNEIYSIITPNVSFREKSSYHYNNVYCSFLIPGETMQFTEMCSGGIVDNNWFALESKYHAMVMVTPHVYDDPKHIQHGRLKKEKYRVEGYFDIDRGRFSGFERHLKQTLPKKTKGMVVLEHLVYSYFAREEQYVEEKGVFLMNGPETKGNLTFAKIYHSLLESAAL